DAGFGGHHRGTCVAMSARRPGAELGHFPPMETIMSTTMRRRFAAAAILGALPLIHLGCAATTTGDPETATSNDAITSEVAGKAEIVVRHYDDPEVARVAFASGDIGNCSATMIGPNVMMTAAHCNGTDKTMTFRTYHRGSPWVSD